MINSDKDANEYQRRICRAIDFVTRNLADNPTVVEIARAAPFSQYHFQRLFKALVGESVAEFTRRLRLETAARRMMHGSGGDDITGLALDLGFSSSQNFAKAFKKHFNVSPTQYAANARNLQGEEHGEDSTDQGSVPSFELPHSSNAIADVVVRQIASMKVAYRRHIGSYEDPEVQKRFDELQTWATARGLDDEQSYLGIPWDEATITPDGKCRFDACLIVPEDSWFGTGVNLQELPAGRYATYRSEIRNHDFDLPWTHLMRSWLPTSGYEPADGPRFELYHSDGTADSEGRWDIEICLPVKPL